MTGTSRTPHVHHSRSHARNSASGNNHHTSNLEPVFYFSGAIILLIFSKFLHAGMLSPALGALGIIILAVSKIWKSKPGIVFSSICIFAMAMAYIWQWVDSWFVIVVSAEFTSKTLVFRSGLSEGLILAFMAWLYHRLLSKIHVSMSQKWFVKKPYVIIFKLLFYFQLFLVLFWVIALFVQQAQPLTRLSAQDSTMIAGAIALLGAGIPAIIYLSKISPDEKKRHRHIHHHRHGGNEPVKNPDID